MSQSVILVALSQPAVGLAIKLEVRQGSTPQEPRQRMSASQVFSLQFSYGPDESSCSSSNLIRVDFTSVDSSACSVGDPPCLAVTNTPQFGSLQKRSCVPSLQLALGFNESYAVVTQFSDAICGSLSLTGGFAVPIGVCSPRMASPALLSFASSVKADLVSTNSVTGRLQHFTFSDSSCSTTAINTVQFDTNNKACDQQSSIKFFPVSLSPQAQSSPPVTTASFSAPMIVASSTVPPAQSTNNAIIFSESNGPSLALIIGVSVGGTVFLIIIVSLTVICFLQHRRQKQHAHSSYSLHRHIPSETSESAPLVPLTHLSLYGTRAATPPSLPPVDRASPIPERYSMFVEKDQNRTVVTANTAFSDQPDLSVLSFYTTRSLKAEIEANPQQQEVVGVPFLKGDQSMISATPRNSAKFQLKVTDWSVDEVAEWVASNDWPDETVTLVKGGAPFPCILELTLSRFKDLRIDGTDLLNLTDVDLFEGLLMSNKEQRAVFLKEVDDLRRR